MRAVQKGFSLLEVLISVLVVSIGMLGIAALQANAIRYSHSAELRSIAVVQAANIADRMIANSRGVQNGSYNAIVGIPSIVSCNPCTSAQIAQNDTSEWNLANQNLLPNGQGAITRNGDRFIITVRWDNNRSGVTGLGCSGDLDVDLACVTMEVQI